MGTDTTFSISQAAEVCGVSRSRIRRLLDAGRFPHAQREVVTGAPASAQPWTVPLSDLLSAGLTVNRPEQATEQPSNGAETEMMRLRHEVEIERTRRLAAEAIAAERERTIEGLQTALRVLTATTPSTPQPEAAAVVAEQVPDRPEQVAGQVAEKAPRGWRARLPWGRG